MTVDCCHVAIIHSRNFFFFCFCKIISHYLIAHTVHEMQRCRNPFRRKVPFVSVRFAHILGIGHDLRGFLISDAVNCRRIYGIFYGEKKRQSIIFNEVGHSQFLGIGILVSSDPCIFEDSYFRVAVITVLSFVDKIVGWIFRQIFKFVGIPDSTALRELLQLSILWKRRERRTVLKSL